MKVRQLMRSTVRTCRPSDSLRTAARIMWDHDCGCVPVIDEDGRIVGMITDRDVCMAAYLCGTSLVSLEVSTAMSKRVHMCRPEDSVVSAEKRMQAYQVRRLPVVDAEEHVVGILSLNDIAREYVHQSHAPCSALRADEIARTLGRVCDLHGPRAALVAA
jgi:CBS domain-containing protein